MDFSPLRYAVGTLTIWHGIAFVAIMGLAVVSHLGSAAEKLPFAASVPGLMLLTFMIVLMYCLAAPTVGQLVGDKYPFAMVWPSALVLECLIAVGYVAFALVSDGKPLTLKLAGFSIFAVAFFSAGITLFVCFAYHLMPRLGALIAYPKMSWGVQL